MSRIDRFVILVFAAIALIVCGANLRQLIYRGIMRYELSKSEYFFDTNSEANSIRCRDARGNTMWLIKVGNLEIHENGWEGGIKPNELFIKVGQSFDFYLPYQGFKISLKSLNPGEKLATSEVKFHNEFSGATLTIPEGDIPLKAIICPSWSFKSDNEIWIGKPDTF